MYKLRTKINNLKGEFEGERFVKRQNKYKRLEM
jgi:hypothetical protein